MVEGKIDIVVVGGGIIGCTTAYYLSRHPSFNPSVHSITLLEATRIGGGASGKAGGLLAQWAYPASIVPLSYDLHTKLAEEHNGVETWGYRRIACGKLVAKDRKLPPAPTISSWAQYAASWIPLGKRKYQKSSGSRIVPGSEMPDDLDWFNRTCVNTFEDISTDGDTAQVHPFQFTTAMARLAEEKGAKVIIGSVDRIEYAFPTDEDGSLSRQKSVCGVTYTDKATNTSRTIPASVVILAAGPWTPVLFPSAPISSLRAHSITIRPPKPVSAYCLFTEITVPQNQEDEDAPEPFETTKIMSPEIYSRPNNEVYVCGAGDNDVPLPPTTDDVEISKVKCQDVVDAVGGISDELRDGVVTSRRACYLPTVDVGSSGGPLIGWTGVKGVMLATGHSCWGIHNAPATGKLVSEIIFDGEAKSAEIGGLDPMLVV
ncbi:fad NAD binding oxidoreductase [Tricladium varicosporioides]|nr:fad NAD binding oxidoreductase [Hymenoscyphus varicosporioides]